MRTKISSNSFTRLTVIFALTGTYLAVSKLGLSLAFAAQQVTVVWPPTGLALAAILLLGYRVWPAIALGAFITNYTANEPFATALAIAVGNTLEAIVGAWLIRRYGSFNTNLHRLKDVFSLLVFSALLSTMIAATIGVTSLCLGGVHPWGSYGFLWVLWWVGDATGALIFAPVLLVWLSKPAVSQKSCIAETLVLMLGLIIICLGVFSEPPHIGIISGHAFIYLIFPFIIWAGLRFGQRGTTLVTLMASVIAIWATLHGLGPFTAASINQSLTLLQIFTSWRWWR
jgi:integral membrane sensor domain MASE1